MTTLAVIGDIHASWEKLNPVLGHVRGQRVDGILLVGDLGAYEFGLFSMATAEVERQYRESAAEVHRQVRELNLPVRWVPGNHDPRDLEGEGNVDGRGDRIGELSIAGIGGAGPDKFGFAYEWDEDDIRKLKLPECDVLLCHGPPRDTPLDLVRGTLHVGSVAIRERAERHRGVLVCGHIHESPALERIGDCLCMNVGGLGRPYGKAQVGYIRGTGELWHVNLETGREMRLRR